MKIEFCKRFFKNPQISNFMKIPPMGAELFHVNEMIGRHDGANSRFLQLCENA